MTKKILLLMSFCLIVFHLAKAQTTTSEPRGPSKPESVGDITNGSFPNAAPAKYTIPVVFHIIKGKDKYFNPTVNQIKETIKQVNKIFRAESEEFKKYIALGKVPLAFKNSWADTEIEFCLAHTDTKGDFTSGIVVIDRSGKTSVENDFSLVTTEKGGSTTWDQKYYMNVYLVDRYLYNEIALNDETGGYNSTYGVVIKGSVDSKVIAHEFGHYFGLAHPFTKDVCGDNDNIGDTPEQGSPTSVLALAKYGIDIIKPGDKWGDCEANGNNYYNMMDYSNVACMFTKGQKDSMQILLNKVYPSLGTSGKCNQGNCVNDKHEPNNSFEDAKLLDPLKQEKIGNVATLGHYFGILCTSYKDEDYFKFKGIKDKKIMVKLYDKIFYDFNLELYKKEGDDYKLVKGSYNVGLGSEYIFIDEKQTGTEEYFVKVIAKDPNAVSNDILANYKYHLYISNNLIKEVESNQNDCSLEPDDNTLAKALPLPIGVDVKGKICYAGDVDYYTFYLPAPLSLVKIIFSSNQDSPNTEETVYNSEGKVMETSFDGVLMEEGFYYIEIKGKTKKDFTPTGYYTINVSSDIAGALDSYNDLQYYCPNYYGEPNNSFFEAEWLVEEGDIGGTNYDAICVPGDQDYFKIQIDNTSDLDLVIYHENGKFGGNDLLPHLFKLTLYAYNQGDQKVVSESSSYINGYLPVKKTYKGLKPDIYYALVEGADEEEYSSDYGYKIDATLTNGGKKIANDLPITLYPNPAKGKATLNIGNILPDTNKKVKITITNQYGKVYREEKRTVENNIVRDLNLTGLPTGNYFIKVEGSNTSYTTHAVIVE